LNSDDVGNSCKILCVIIYLTVYFLKVLSYNIEQLTGKSGSIYFEIFFDI